MSQELFKNAAKILNRLVVFYDSRNDEVAKSETDFLCQTNTRNLILASVIPCF